MNTRARARRGGGNPAARWIIGGAALATVIAAALLLADPLYVLAGVGGLLVVWAAFEYPFFGVVLYMLVQYLRPGDMIPALAPLRPAVGVIGLLWAAFLLRLFLRREVRPVKHPVLAAFAYFLIVVAVSVPFAEFWRGGARDTFLNLARLGLGIYLLLQLVDTWPRFRAFLWVWMAEMAFLATWNNVLYYTGQKSVPDTGGSGGMLGGFMGDGNDFALALNVLIPVGLVLYRVEAKARWRWLALFCALTSVLSIVATTSRGGMIGLAAALAVLMLAHRPSVRTGAALAGTGVLVVLLVYLALPAVWEKKFAPFFSPETNPAFARVSKLDEYQQDESARGRLDAWGAGLRMFADHPILGVGAGVYSMAYGMKYKPYGAVTATWREAHSIYFQILGELGILGVAGMAWIFASILRALLGLRRAWRGPTPGRRWATGVASALVASVAAFAASGAFLSAFYYPHVYMLGTTAVMMALLTRQGAPPFGEPAEAPAPEEAA
jgi:probable O-glycosylation ligase (exosortase A-associated)